MLIRDRDVASHQPYDASCTESALMSDTPILPKFRKDSGNVLCRRGLVEKVVFGAINIIQLDNLENV